MRSTSILEGAGPLVAPSPFTPVSARTADSLAWLWFISLGFEKSGSLLFAGSEDTRTIIISNAPERKRTLLSL